MISTVSNPFQEIHSELANIKDTLALLVARVQPKATQRFYTVDEASKILSVSKVTLYRGIECGEIPHKRIGSRVLIPSSYLDDERKG